MKTDEPQIVECGRCGQNAEVTAAGIRCACLPALSAVEHHALRRQLAAIEASERLRRTT